MGTSIGIGAFAAIIAPAPPPSSPPGRPLAFSLRHDPLDLVREVVARNLTPRRIDHAFVANADPPLGERPQRLHDERKLTRYAQAADLPEEGVLLALLLPDGGDAASLHVPPQRVGGRAAQGGDAVGHRRAHVQLRGRQVYAHAGVVGPLLYQPPDHLLPGADGAVRCRRVQVQKIVPLAKQLRGDEHVARQHADVERVRLQEAYHLAVAVAPPLRQRLAPPRLGVSPPPPPAAGGRGRT